MEQQILSFPVLFSFLIFLLVLFKLLISRSNLPPGPRKLPFIGNLHQLSGEALHHRLRKLANTYGPIMGGRMGQIPFVVISSPATAKEVLRIQDPTFAERPLILVAELVMYNRHDISLAAYGEQWRQLRKICTMELLSNKRVQSFRSVREEEVAECVKLVRSKEGSSVNVTQTVFASINSIVARNAIGHRSKNQKALLDVINELILSGGGANIVDIFPYLKWLPAAKRERGKIWKLHRRTDDILEDILKEHRSNRQTASKSGQNIQADNLLDVLLDLQESGNLDIPLTDTNIKGVIIDTFVGGSDTSSTTVEWAMVELMKHPEEMKKAQKELRNLFDDEGYVEESRLNELTYLKLVIKETMRLHPAVALIQRVCKEKTKVNGYDIYPETRVLINVWAIGRDPEAWSEPEKFKPERFAESSVDYKGSNFELLPFGAGKRICPAITFAVVNLEIFLANLLYHFDWEFPDGVTAENLDMKEVVGAAVKRQVDLELIPTPYRRP